MKAKFLSLVALTICVVLMGVVPVSSQGEGPQATVPFTETFDSVSMPDIPPGWTVENTNGDNKQWETHSSSPSGHSAPNSLRIAYNPNEAMNDWAFSPGLELTGGVTYAVSFWYRAGLSGNPEKMEIKWGTAPTSTAMTEGPIFDNASIANTNWVQASAQFTPSVSGSYYLGWHAYSNADTYSLAIDDVAVYEAAAEWMWTGAVDDSWHTSGNWEMNLIPGSANDVRIPGTPSGGNFPVLRDTDHAHAANLTIDAGASFSLESFWRLYVEGTLVNNGTLREIHTLNIGSPWEFLHITNEAGDTDKYRGVDITANTTSLGDTIVEVKGNQTGGCTTNPSDALLHRCYVITPTSQYPSLVRFYYTEAERNGQAADAVALWHYDGPPGQWSLAGNTYAYSESGSSCTQNFCWFQADNVATYSPFGVGSGSQPTAVTLRGITTRSTFSVVGVGTIGLLCTLRLVLMKAKRREER